MFLYLYISKIILTCEFFFINCDHLATHYEGSGNKIVSYFIPKYLISYTLFLSLKINYFLES